MAENYDFASWLIKCSAVTTASKVSTTLRLILNTYITNGLNENRSCTLTVLCYVSLSLWKLVTQSNLQRCHRKLIDSITSRVEVGRHQYNFEVNTSQLDALSSTRACLLAFKTRSVNKPRLHLIACTPLHSTAVVTQAKSFNEIFKPVVVDSVCCICLNILAVITVADTCWRQHHWLGKSQPNKFWKFFDSHSPGNDQKLLFYI